MYRIFDILLKSNISLPELPKVSQGNPSLSFHLLSSTPEKNNALPWFQHWETPQGEVTLSFAKNKEYYLRFPYIADFEISEELDTIFCSPYPAVAEETVRHLLVDQVIPRVLSGQGRTVLHASAVRTGEGCIVFLGESGWGKSTLATSFHRQGKELLTDDCIMFKNINNGVVGIPSYAGSRLWQDSFDCLALPGDELRGVAHYSSKKRIVLRRKSEHVEHMFPIVAIFILSAPEEGSNSLSLSIDRLSNARATIEFLKNSFQMEMVDKRELLSRLRILAGGTQMNIPVYTLAYTRNLLFLPTIHKAIEVITDAICSGHSVNGEETFTEL